MYKYCSALGPGLWTDQPICTVFLSALSPSLPFEHWRDSCFILPSRAWPSRAVQLRLLPLRLLLALSLVLFSAPSALSPGETERSLSTGRSESHVGPSQRDPPESARVARLPFAERPPAPGDRLLLLLQAFDIFLIFRGGWFYPDSRKQTALARACQEDCWW